MRRFCSSTIKQTSFSDVFIGRTSSYNSILKYLKSRCVVNIDVTMRQHRSESRHSWIFSYHISIWHVKEPESHLWSTGRNSSLGLRTETCSALILDQKWQPGLEWTQLNWTFWTQAASQTTRHYLCLWLNKLRHINRHIKHHISDFCVYLRNVSAVFVFQWYF